MCVYVCKSVCVCVYVCVVRVAHDKMHVSMEKAFLFRCSIILLVYYGRHIFISLRIYGQGGWVTLSTLCSSSVNNCACSRDCSRECSRDCGFLSCYQWI